MDRILSIGWSLQLFLGPLQHYAATLPASTASAHLRASRLGKSEGGLGVVVGGGRGQRRTHSAHRDAVAPLSQLLEHGGRGILLGSCSDLLEPRGEGLAFLYVSSLHLLVHLHYLLGDEVSQRANRALRPRIQPLPEVVLGPQKYALVHREQRFCVAGFTSRVLETPKPAVPPPTPSVRVRHTWVCSRR